MSQIEVKPIDCPHCKGKIEVEIERKQTPAKVIIQKDDSEIEISKIVDATVERINKMGKGGGGIMDEPPAKKKDEPILEKFVPGYRCKNCGNVHQNKNYKERPKGKCSNCDQFSNVKSGPCPWCAEGEIEPVSDEDLDDLKIVTPPERPDDEQHEH